MTLLETTTPAVDQHHPAWTRLKNAVTAFRPLQRKDGALAEGADPAEAARLMPIVRQAVAELAPAFPHDAEYLAALPRDFGRWVDGGFGVPDFLD